MKRDIYTQLVNWKNNQQRKPLILRGARQVGKTHILKTFAKQEYKDLCYINFESDRGIHEFFKEDLNPKIILEQLSLYYDLKINPKTTLIIFDEIQECGNALNSLKYFCEQAKEYHIAAAGSLLGVKLANTKGFPVGKVDFLNLYPMSFYEFLTAINKANLREFIESINLTTKIPTPIHNQLIELLRKYFYIGGMPAVIRDFIDSQDYNSARNTQLSIVDAYLFDFSKHAEASHIIKINQVWNSLPGQLSKENKKFIFSAIKSSARGREYEYAIQWLLQAGLSLKCSNVSTPNLPLKAYANLNTYKLYMSDVGLLGAMTDLDKSLLTTGVTLFKEFKGALTENFVAQQLITLPSVNELYYWTSSGTAEVDFLLSSGKQVFPVEVKSGEAIKSKSLKIFKNKYEPKHILRLSPKNIAYDDNLLNLPLYAIGALENILHMLD